MSSTGSTPATGKLLTEFAPVSYEDWRKLVEAELKGAPFDKKMFSNTYEGIQLRPIYTAKDTENLAHANTYPGFAPFVRGATASGYVGRPWDISQEVTAATPVEFNTAALSYISRGLTGINMMLDHATRDGHDPDWARPDQVGAGGLSIATLEDLEKTLKGVDLETTRLFVRCGPSGLPFGALLAGLIRRRKKSAAILQGCIETDPLGVLSHEGKLPQSLNGAYREMAALTRWAAENAPRLQTICVHTRAWHEAGANAVQELGVGLATGLEYLKAMADRELPVNVTAPRIRWAVTVGVNFFMEIAKIRAFRMLWAHLVGALDGDHNAQRMALHIRTSRWNKTVCDPYNNLLRSTVEAFAGMLGGCDSMQVGAFDEVVREPDDFSQRIARNTQLILQNECNLEDIIDPAGGSYYVESLTGELAQKGWAFFQDIQKQGGMEAALRSGFAQKSVATTAAEKLKNAARRRDSIVGVNQYANPGEKSLEKSGRDAVAFHRRRAQQVASYRTAQDDDRSQGVLEQLSRVVEANDPKLFEACVEAVTSGATLGEVTRSIRISDQPEAGIAPVCTTRLASGFEALRAGAARFQAADGKLPQVFLCNMGPLKEHKARADFSRGFLAAGGFQCISPEGFKTPEAAAEAFGRSGTGIAVICSTDDNYPALVPPLVKALRQQKPDAYLVLAGYPAEQVEAHKKAGVNEFLHMRADALELLRKFHSTLGIL